MLRLLITDTQEAQQPVVPVQWCITAEAVQGLRYHGVQKPYLLISVTNSSNREVTRELIPLDRMQHRIQFSNPGRHTIHARIVWDNIKGLSGLIKRYLSVGEFFGTYKRNIFSFDDELGMETISEAYVPGIGLATSPIEIADGFFAKEPPAWLKWWANLWYETPLHDQCHLRKRLIISSVPKLLTVPLYALAVFLIRSSIATFWILCGMRGVRLQPAFHPFKMLRSQITSKIPDHAQWFIWDSKGKERRWDFLYVFFTPIIPVGLFPVFAGIIYLIAVSYGLPARQLLLQVCMLAAAVAIAVPVAITLLLVVGVVCITIGALAGKLVASIFRGVMRPLVRLFFGRRTRTGVELLTRRISAVAEMIFGWTGAGARAISRLLRLQKIEGALFEALDKIEERMEVAVKARAARMKEKAKADIGSERYTEQFRPLLCNGRQDPIPAREIPLSLRRTPVLLFEEIRALVCKPYAKSR